MTSEQWAEIKERFHEALAQSVETRTAFLAGHCSSEIVRAEVEHLLSQYNQAGSFLSQTATASIGGFVAPRQRTDDEFPSSIRFECLNRLGAGTFGIVYRAFDRQRNGVVALKKLIQYDPAQLLRFKHEFRSLVGLIHPNLVQLYELFGEQRQWFFTMELIDGVDFVSYVRTSSADVNWDRLRAALGDLANGVQDLHSMGRLHRDLKPPNVLVTPQGRVVILDFGLVKEIDAESIEQSFAFAGSPAYMAPEQGTQRCISEMTDWYAVGVMLYKAITGQLPFSGTWKEILDRKQSEDSPPSRVLNPTVPDDLDEACRHLLERDPNLRAKGVSILRAMANRPAIIAERKQEIFVGRRRELDLLQQRFSALSSGNRQVVLLGGRSGIGKTSLVHRFLIDVKHQNPSTIILKGRCREYESVPYKALDSIADELVRYLQFVPEPVAMAVLPRHPELLRLLFPVFGQLENLHPPSAGGAADLDEQQMRRRAFEALCELLGRMSDRNRIVMWIDDLQWADLDSLAFLAELTLAANAPTLLLLLSFRSEESGTSAALEGLRKLQPRLNDADSWLEIPVHGLSEAEGRELLRLLQDQLKPISAERSEEILTESGGIPLFLSELLHFSTDKTANGVKGKLITEMIRHRASTLSLTARELLEALSVAGEPLSGATLYRTVNQTDEDPARAIGLLLQEHLIRVTSSEAGTKFEPFHDQVREASLSWLSAAGLRSWHSHLAEVLETEDQPDPQKLLPHYRGSGNLPATFETAISAAKIAENALAFEQAAQFYMEALQTGQADEAAQANLHRKRADALAKAGRGYESAQSYLQAARSPARSSIDEMRRLAAEQLMCSGYLDEGTHILAELMRTAGIVFPKTPLESILRMTAIRLFIRVRGLRWRERTENEIAPETLRRLDLLWIGAEALASGNPIFGTYLQARHMLEALRTGEPFRLALSLGLGTFYESVKGYPELKRGRQLLDLATELATRFNDPYLLSMIELCGASLHFNCGRVEAGLHHCRASTEILDKVNRRATAFELGTNNLILSWFLGWGGKIRELSEKLPIILQDARSRGDVYSDVAIRTFYTAHLVDLADDDPERAIAETTHAIQQWRKTRYDLQHFGATFAIMECHLYAGRTEQARAVLLADAPAIGHSLLFRKGHIVRATLFYARGRTALAEWLRDPAAHHLRAETEKSAAKLTSLKSAWGEAFNLLLRAGIMAGMKRRNDALRLLEKAEEILRQQDLRLFAAAVSRRRGELEGQAGTAKIDAADAFMRSENILRPDKMTSMILPGSWL
jgi:serine/threonine protein kinase